MYGKARLLLPGTQLLNNGKSNGAYLTYRN